MTTPKVPTPVPPKVRIFLLTVYPDAAHPPTVKEIFSSAGIDQNMPPNVRQFIINMSVTPGGTTTIKEVY